MPYLDKKTKELLKKGRPLKAGELNYVMTCLARDFARDRLYKGGRYDYERLNTVVGVCESMKLEFWRRMMVPYEDNKIKENGDVY